MDREQLAFWAESLNCLKGFMPVHALMLLLPLAWAVTGKGSWQVPAWIAAYGLACVGLAMVGIRWGLAHRWRDPAMLTLQIWSNLGLVALIYTLVPPARSVALQVMCLVLVHERRGLTEQQSQLVSLWVTLLLLAGVAWLGRFNIQSLAFDQELI